MDSVSDESSESVMDCALQDALMVTDEELLQGMLRCRQLGALPQVHAENGEAVVLGQKMVFDAGEA